MMKTEQEIIQDLEARLARQTVRLVWNKMEYDTHLSELENAARDMMRVAMRLQPKTPFLSVFDENSYEDHSARFMPLPESAEDMRMRVILYDESGSRVLDLPDGIPPKRHSSVYLNGKEWVVNSRQVVLNCDGVPCEVHCVLD